MPDKTRGRDTQESLRQIREGLGKMFCAIFSGIDKLDWFKPVPVKRKKRW